MATLLGDGVSVWIALAAMLGGLASYLFSFIFAMALSILYPKAANLAKLDKQGKPPTASVLIGFIGFAIATLPAVIAGLGGLLVAGEIGVLVAEIVILILAGVTFYFASTPLASFFHGRRDQIYLAVREG